MTDLPPDAPSGPPLLVEFDNLAGPIVYGAYDRSIALGNAAFSTAQDAVRDLGYYVPQPISFSANFNPQIALSGFPAISRPTLPDGFTFNAPATPSAPPTVELGTYSPGTAPTFDQVAPTLVMPNAPQIVQLTPPGSAPVLTSPTLPIAPDVVLPDVPTMQALNIPAPPSITFPSFTSARPVFDVPIPDETFSFSPQAYVSSLLDSTKALILNGQQGGTGLPDAVTRALRNRAYADADADSQRAVSEAYDEFAARGFMEPAPQLSARVTEARQAGAKVRAGVNRDVFVQEEQVAIQQLNFFTTAGIQLEGQTMQLHVSETQFALEAAKYAVDAAISILNARVSVFNAQMQAYAIDAQVFRDLIQEALAQLEVYKAQLQGQQLIGQINEQTVKLYLAQLQGVNTMVDVYKSQLSAVESEVKINELKLEGFTETVRAYTAQIEAQTSQWGGYRAQVDAQLGVGQFYATTVNAFGQRVQAYNVTEQSKIEAARLTLQRSAQSIDSWRAGLSLYDSQLRAEAERFDTLAKVYGSEVDAYRADAAVATASGEYNNRRFQLNLAQEQAIVDTELKRAQLDMQQMQFISTVLSEIKRAVATVSAQLASSALSIISTSATVGSNHSSSMGYQLGVSYYTNLTAPTS